MRLLGSAHGEAIPTISIRQQFDAIEADWRRLLCHRSLMQKRVDEREVKECKRELTRFHNEKITSGTSSHVAQSSAHDAYSRPVPIGSGGLEYWAKWSTSHILRRSMRSLCSSSSYHGHLLEKPRSFFVQPSTSQGVQIICCDIKCIFYDAVRYLTRSLGFLRMCGAHALQLAANPGWVA